MHIGKLEIDEGAEADIPFAMEDSKMTLAALEPKGRNDGRIAMFIDWT